MPTSPTILEFDSSAEEQATTVDTHGFSGIVCQEREIHLKNGASTLEDRYSGAWDDLEALAFQLHANRPDVTIRGSTFSFSDVRLKSRRKGLRGELTASYTLTSSASATQGDPDELEILWEVESIQVTSAIQAAKPLEAYADQITQWMMADPELKREWKFKDGNSEVTLSGQALAAAKLIAGGTTGFLQFYPVIRKITKLKDANNVVVCANLMKVGDPDDCPIEVAGEWEWLATADHLAQQQDRTWRRVQMWTGAETWDEILYERVSSGNNGGGAT